MKEAAINIVKRLREEGHVAYFNGGCVRDMVRGLSRTTSILRRARY